MKAKLGNKMLSRRRFTGYFCGALLTALAALGVPRLGSLLSWALRPHWYEVVQDMRDPNKWHVNLFASPRIGDLEKAEHLGYRVVEASNIKKVLEQLGYPARIQFRNGHKEQAF